LLFKLFVLLFFVMCGRYSFVWLLNKLQDEFGSIRVKSDGFTKYNISPGQLNPVILEDENQAQIIDFYRWGLVPHWALGKPNFGFRTINARVEGISDSPMYKRPFLNQRCIVPASGFYEWQKGTTGKTPFYIHPTKLPYFAFAGIYESWKTDDGVPFNSYSIITRAADKEMSKLHDRMPVMLKKKHFKEWVASGDKPESELKNILEDYEHDLKFHIVSKDVNSSRNESESLIKPVQGTLF